MNNSTIPQNTGTSSITPHCPGFNDHGLSPKQVISAHTRGIEALAYFGDGRRVVTGSLDGTVKIWNVEEGEQEGPSMMHVLTQGIAVTRDGTKVISAGWNGDVKVWDVESRRLVKRWNYQCANRLALSPDDRFVAVGGITVGIHSLEGVWVNTIDVNTVSLCFSPDGSKLACGERDISAYDVKTGTCILRVRPLEGHRDGIWSLLWSHNGARIFSGSVYTIHCWDSATGQQIGDAWTGHTELIGSLSLSPDGSTLASASNDKTVRFWDAATGASIGRLQHADSMSTISFSPSGDSVASATEDGKLYLWQAPRRMEPLLAQPPPPCTHMQSDSESELDFDHLFPQFSCTTNASSSLAPGTHLPFSGESSSTIVAEWLDRQSTVFPDVSLSQEEAQYIFDPFISDLLHHSSQVGRLQMHPGLNFTTNWPPPPDLTPYIIKKDDSYVAGGGFGDVYRCWYCDGSSKEVAVKALRFRMAENESTSKRSLKMFHRELGIWRRLEHRNIVPFLGIAYGFGMQGSMSLVSLWMTNKSLDELLTKYDNHLHIGHRLQLLLDIANGLHYLHCVPIVHGDLNSNNVLVDADLTARLTDFGYASLVGNIPEALSYLQRSTARPGALRWIAPEQINFEDTFNHTPKSDIYSFGCVAVQVLSGKQPWSEIRQEPAIVLRLARGDHPSRPESRRIDDSHWDLIRHCWSSVEERSSAEAIIARIQRFLDDCPLSSTPASIDKVLAII